MSPSASAVLLAVCLGAAVAAQDAGGRLPAPPSIRSRCLSCHGLDLIEQQKLSRSGWERELDKMTRWGATVPDSERALLLDALQQFSRGGAAGIAGLEQDTARGAEVFAQRCLRCHGVDIVQQQRLTAAGWRREVDKMIGWGARIDDSEREPLVSYLARRYGVG